MLKITKNKIYLTRGDTAFIEVALTDQDGNPYIPTETDTVYFRLKQTAMSKVVLLEKIVERNVIEEGTSSVVQLLLELQEDDTKDFKFTTYKYEVEVVTENDYHFTAIENVDFEIGPELELHNG